MADDGWTQFWVKDSEFRVSEVSNVWGIFGCLFESLVVVIFFVFGLLERFRDYEHLQSAKAQNITVTVDLVFLL